MPNNRTSIALGCCFFAMTVSAWAQSRKTGLWELTTVQTWQQSPFPPGAAGAAPGGDANSSSAGGTYTKLVCLTQQEIDKYGAIVPRTRGCQVTNVVKKSGGMTADWVCTGAISGKGTMESHMVDSDHAKGTLHFVGTLQARPNAKPIEWTTQSSSVFKSADCGDVKPVPLPDDK
jgi:hypothetical protein